MPTTHRLVPDARSLHGHFSADLPPVLEVDPGDTVVLSTLEAGWSTEPVGPGSGPPVRRRHPSWHDGAGHALVGPIRVRGATAGSTLAVHVEEVVPAAWGYTVGGGWPSRVNERHGIAGEGVVHAWSLDPASGTGRNQHGHTVRLRPFLGVLGLAPAAPGRHSTIPPRRCGGNLDCRELVAGSVLYLPVEVDGALLSAGDGHAAQGDGEVSGTAIECPLDRVRLRLEVLEDLPLRFPAADTPAGRVSLGVGDTLDDAADAALEGMFDHLVARYGVSRADAVALASVVVDVRVTQIVNQVVGVHAVLPHGAVEQGAPAPHR